MTTLSRPQLEAFLPTLLTETNFPIFSRLLYLQNKANFNIIMELLYSYKINIFDLINIPNGITDTTISNFIHTYNLKFSPIQTMHNSASTFNSAGYLDTNSLYIGIERMVVAYNQYKNDNVPEDRSNYNINLSYGKPEYGSYSSDLEIKNIFTNDILPLILVEFNINNIRDIFPLAADWLHPVMMASYPDLAAKYNSIFEGHLPYLDNDNFYKVILSLNDTTSINVNLRDKLYHIINFDSRNGLVLSLKQTYLNYLNYLSMGFTSTDRDNFINIYTSQLLDNDISLEYNYVLFHYTLHMIYNINNALVPDYSYTFQLQILAYDINRMKQLIRFTYDLCIHKFNTTG